MANGPRGVLRFSYGIMGSGKSTVALQVHHNLTRRGLRGVLCTLFDREGTAVSSRYGGRSAQASIRRSVAQS